MAHRFCGVGEPYEGLVHIVNERPTWNGNIKFAEERLLDPIRWQKRRRVFVNSMSDLFHENVTDEMVDKIFAVMSLAPRHRFQILTKRPERMKAYFADLPDRERCVQDQIAEIMLGYVSDREHKRIVDLLPQGWVGIPLRNVWLGVSVEDQAAANKRIPLLLDTPAALRFISAEPLLANLRLNDGLGLMGAMGDLDWVIVGGESGKSARPCYLTWISSIVEQCKTAGVPVFVKQLGGNLPDWDLSYIERVTGHSLAHKKGGEISEWPREFRIQEFPRESDWSNRR